MIMSKFNIHPFRSYHIKDIEEFISIADLLSGKNWFFRGHSNSEYKLQSTFERALSFYYKIIEIQGSSKKNEDMENTLREYEKRYILEFKSRAHHFLNNTYAYNNKFDWYSLLRHYSGPSRMIDFTKSIYISLFFATPKQNNSSCIWAINPLFLSYPDDYNRENDINSYVESNLQEWNGNDGVVLIKPSIQSERMAVQQGFFFYPIQLSKPFLWNLFSSMQIHRNVTLDKEVKNIPTKREYILRNKIVKFIIPTKMKISIMKLLYEININSSTLFPDLEGFAKSLYLPTDIEMEDAKEIIINIRKLIFNQINVDEKVKNIFDKMEY